ncbi:class I SAM-dependent methyltransferase [Saccharopolyspora sp. HNM0983]|uniref:Class I SAM-dependent methyltransferase n=1 Tax=Saccharopolyspora montiporae TaxID=2781240 RepID=A0A929B7I7_9PSEU|nr:class I SAM-dependent methyltransferase [Saccharopolyspora sp. HNM0983]MBE9373635.1 class I SAM-dependent methyltransferase [Saccharopolyspora sp. HNM0983]
MTTEFTAEDIDFESVYRGESPLPDSAITFDRAPWDIGEPQPAVVAAAESGQLAGSVLDAGCGTGDNAIFLAGRGVSVLGVDGAATAVDTARDRAAQAGVEVEFRHTDVTTMDGVDRRSETVLDSALYHCLTGEQRSAYAAALHAVTAPGAQLHLFCFADVDDAGFRLPPSMTVSRADLRAHLAEHWNITGIEATDYTTVLTRELVERAGPQNLRDAGMVIDLPALRTDERGRILGRVWHLRAERR